MPPLQLEQVAASSPFAGVAGYAIRGERPVWVGDYLLSYWPRLEDGKALLVPRAGGTARAFQTESLGSPERYSALNRQTFVMRVGYPNDACRGWGISALDPATLETRWVFRPSQEGDVEGLEIGSMFILRIGHSWRRQEQLLGLDLSSGRLLWQRLMPVVSESRAKSLNAAVKSLGTNGQVLFEVASEELRALDPLTGTTLWTLPRPKLAVDEAAFGPRHTAFFVERAAASTRAHPQPCDGQARCLHELSVWDLDLRQELYRTPLFEFAGYIGVRHYQVQFQGRDLVLLEPVDIRGIRGFRVRVLAADSGAERFKAPAQPCGAAGELEDAQLSGTDTAIQACGCDGVLRVLSRATGQLEGSFSVGSCSSLAMHGGRIAHGELTMNLPGFSSGTAILQPGAFTAEERTVVVSGTVSVDGTGSEKNRWVRVGSELFRANEQGSFTARVSGRGVLSVDVAVRSDEDDDGGTSESVVLDRPPNRPLGVSLLPPPEHH